MNLALALLLSLAHSASLSSTHLGDQAQTSHPIQFVDITRPAGITWNLRALAPGVKYLIETMGGGGGFIDYNQDGLLDIYLVCYSQTPQPVGASKLRDVLYRNNGDGTFIDVTEKAGISNSMLGMGLAVGDYDNDGWPDMYVTGYGASKLYRNTGKGTFVDVTAKAAVSNSLWGTSTAFFDYDNDGYLDLYVCNYLKLDLNEKLPCTFFEGKPYCYIAQMKGSSSRLFRNNRNGTFADVSEKARIAIPGKGLGVIAVDYNNDGRIDIYQANDTVGNFLFRNNGQGAFSEVALEAGVAYDPNGHARGGMGVDAEDIDGDGNLEFFVTNFSAETNALFHNDGDGLFTETTHQLGLGQISLPMSGFGTRFFDYNNDGLVDLFVLNGHPFEPINKISPETTYAEPPFLFENTGKGFRDVAADHGEPLKRHYSGRGLALGDIDNDGDSDLLLINVGQPPVLLRNDGGNKNHWLGIKLVGAKSNRDGIGAKVTVKVGGVRRTRQLLGGTSYCSASEMRMLFGLGATQKVDEVEVRWPSGQVSKMKNVEIKRYLTVKENLPDSKRHIR
ncbi:MAG TPA: CRTAC1 family protein [Pyrinomonadaceae bacterium]|nr:CRTAC1 family protein [Pyrinomonadaceae bacterium]